MAIKNKKTYNWNCPKYGPDRWDDPAISILVMCGDMRQKSESLYKYNAPPLIIYII